MMNSRVLTWPDPIHMSANAKMVKKNTQKKSKSQTSQSQVGKPVNYSAASSSQTRTGQAKISHTSKGMRVVHSELIDSVNGSINFTALKFPVQPGNARTFPWLSVIANQWDEYTIHKIHFRYITRLGNQTVGSVLMAPDYDASDPTPIDERSMTQHQDCVENVTYAPQTCVLRKQSMFGIGPRRFVRSVLVAGTDVKMYDCANFYFGTVGQVGSSEIGKLWVDYDVEFFVPQSNPSASIVPSDVSFYLPDPTTTSAGVLVPTLSTVLSDPIGVGLPVAGVFTPMAGSFLVSALICFPIGASETSRIEFYKNGAPLAPPIYSVFANLVLQQTQGFLLGPVTLNGTDTFEVRMGNPSGGLTTLGAGMISFSIA